MLGDEIGDLEAQVTGTRVLSTDPPEVEVSFQGTGKLLGLETMEIGTYTSVLRPDGTFYGEGEGINMTPDGHVATWKGGGVGHPTGAGMAASYRGAIYYTTTSEKLRDLNHVAALFEWDVDENGHGSAKIWEWK